MYLDSVVKGYQTRIEDKQKKIQELAEKKATTKDETQIRAALDEMIIEAKEMKEIFVKFQKEKKRLKYEYPSHGDDTDRKYRRFELETIEELNSLSNVDLRLKGLLQRIERVYEKPPEKVAKEQQREEEKRKASTKLYSNDKKESEPVLDSRPKLSY